MRNIIYVLYVCMTLHAVVFTNPYSLVVGVILFPFVLVWSLSECRNIMAQTPMGSFPSTYEILRLRAPNVHTVDGKIYVGAAEVVWIDRFGVIRFKTDEDAAMHELASGG